ncbi:MAG: hypothetical protein AB1921_19720 [Thermodesulfobacteriota bacterium]
MSTERTVKKTTTEFRTMARGFAWALAVLAGLACFAPNPACCDDGNLWYKSFDASVPYTTPLVPDARSAYSIFPWDATGTLGQNLVVKITGIFPYARYMSYNVYDFAERDPLLSIADRQIIPDPGCVNPYSPGEDRQEAPEQRTYTIWFVPGTENDHSAVFDKGDFPNIRYLGVLGKQTGENQDRVVELPLIMYRLYLPDQWDPFNPYLGLTCPASGPEDTVACGVSGCARYECKINGWVPLPRIETFELKEGPDGDFLAPLSQPPLPPIAETVLDVAAEVLSAGLTSDVESTENGDSVDFYNFRAGGLLPNENNKYVCAGLSVLPGKEVAVIRFKPPTYPDTSLDGDAYRSFPDPDPQVRYFSMNMSGALSTLTTGAVCDTEAKVAPDGYIYIVTGPDDQTLRYRVNAVGMNFLPRGLEAFPVLVYRHMMARKDFTKTCGRVPEYSKETFRKAVGRYANLPFDDDLSYDFNRDGRVTLADFQAKTFMGAYAPQGKYFTRFGLSLRMGTPGFTPGSLF